MTPDNAPEIVKKLHAAYEARTGYQIRLNMHRERMLADWCSWSDWTWTETDLAIVIFYLRAKVAKGERNEGSLKFENLIGSPDRFEEDLNLAKEARKGQPIARPAKHTTATDIQPPDDLTPAERSANFKALLKQP